MVLVIVAKEWWAKYIYAAARRVWRWSAARRAAKKAALLFNGKSKCAKCRKGYAEKETQVDHINPVVPIEGQESWDQYLKNLLSASSEDLQVLCKPCHKKKSQAENKARKDHKLRVSGR